VAGFYAATRPHKAAAPWQIIAPPRTLDSVLQKPVADLGVCSLLPQASGLLYD